MHFADHPATDQAPVLETGQQSQLFAQLWWLSPKEQKIIHVSLLSELGPTNPWGCGSFGKTYALRARADPS